MYLLTSNVDLRFNATPPRTHTHTYTLNIQFSFLSLSLSFHADRRKEKRRGEERKRENECEGKEERLTSTSATYSTDYYSSRDEVLRKEREKKTTEHFSLLLTNSI